MVFNVLYQNVYVYVTHIKCVCVYIVCTRDEKYEHFVTVCVCVCAKYENICCCNNEKVLKIRNENFVL